LEFRQLDKKSVRISLREQGSNSDYGLTLEALLDLLDLGSSANAD
jgi:hypothetical protein